MRAPRKRIQTSSKAAIMSPATKQTIANINLAWQEYCNAQSPDNLRDYRNLKSQVKKAIKEDKDKQDRGKVADAVTSNDQWKEVKNIIGWTSYGGPKMLIVDVKPVTSPKEMAKQLNKDYIVRTGKAARSTPPPQQDPLISYNRMLENKQLNMAFQPIRRIELVSIIDSINPSKSASVDDISMKLLRRIKKTLLPILQHLVNVTIMTTKYPDPLKITKIIPLLKKDKDQSLTSSYRGVNLIPAVAKVIDMALLVQLLHHLQYNNLIPHQHHRGVKNHGTATALATLVDLWATKMEQGMDSVALIMDQSLAYDLVDHSILIRKLQALGLDHHSIKLMESYLSNRQQAVQVETFLSPLHHTGPRLVIQGSALSCVLYIVFTLDLPLIFDHQSIRVKHEEASNRPKSITYIDDNFIHVEYFNGKTLQEAVDYTVASVDEYMANNKLLLNPKKKYI